MRIFYDFEFLENGQTIEPISVGMVTDDGRELYAVFEETGSGELHRRICDHTWLMEHVVPSLPLAFGTVPRAPGGGVGGSFVLDWSSNLVMPRRMIRNAVRDLFDATVKPELWAYYGAYDHIALMQLFGRMIDRPSRMPMYTNDLKQLCNQLGDPKLPPQEAGEHNALEDARWNKLVHRFLAGIASSRECSIPGSSFTPDLPTFK